MRGWFVVIGHPTKCIFIKLKKNRANVIALFLVVYHKNVILPSKCGFSLPAAYKAKARPSLS